MHPAYQIMYVALTASAIFAPYVSRNFTIVVACLCFMTPLLMDPDVALQNRHDRAIAGISVPFYGIRLLQLVLAGDYDDKKKYDSVLKRILHLYIYYDAHIMEVYTSYSVPWQQVKSLVPKLAFSCMLMQISTVVMNFEVQNPVMFYVARYLSMFVKLYLFLPILDYVFKLFILPFGYFIPLDNTIHGDVLFWDAKEPSDVSLSIFWAKHWNKVMQADIFKPYCFTPVYNWIINVGFSKTVARLAGSFLTFVFSSLWHSIPIWYASGCLPHYDPFHARVTRGKDASWSMGWMMFSFFMIQWFGIVAEFICMQPVAKSPLDKLGEPIVDSHGEPPKKESLFWRKLWCYTMVLGTSPLLIEPILSVVYQ